MERKEHPCKRGMPNQVSQLHAKHEEEDAESASAFSAFLFQFYIYFRQVLITWILFMLDREILEHEEPV